MFAELLLQEQWYLHDYFRPSEMLSDDELLGHRNAISRRCSRRSRAQARRHQAGPDGRADSRRGPEAEELPLPSVTISQSYTSLPQRPMDSAMVVAELLTDRREGQALAVELDGLFYFGWCHPLVAQLDTVVPE